MLIEPIGFLKTCFGSKFAVPRQPGLAPHSWGVLELEPKYRSEEAVRGLEEFSHVWLVFGFHQNEEKGWKPTVRPPRLGGNDRVGVFASRSTFRPNGLGLSLVKLDKIDWEGAEGGKPPVIHVSGVDLVTDTPVFDIKPYLAYAESIPEAVSGYAQEEIQRFSVQISEAAREEFEAMDERSRKVIEEVLSLDTRPAAGAKDADRIYGAALCGRDIRYQVDEVSRSVSVVEIV